MQLRALGPVLLAAALLVSGCDSNGDDPTTAQAAKDVSAWMEELETMLTDGIEPLRPWQTTDDGSRDHKSGCEDGRASRTYVATLDVPSRSTTLDPDNREALLMGQLIRTGWDPSGTDDDDDTSGSVSASRTKDDPTGTKLTIRFSPVNGGWHYDVTARTACLPTD